MTDDDVEKLTRLAAEARNDRFMCENCGWYAKADERVGECHRLPPLSPASMPGELWRHPVVDCESVCGEFIHRKTAKRFLPDPVEPLRARIAGIEQDVERLKRGFTLVEALVVLAIILTLVGLLWPAISAVRDVAKRGGHPSAAAEIPETWELYTRRHDGHMWILNGSSYFAHHPACPCLTRQPETDTLTETETWALSRIITSEEKQWGDSNTARAFRDIIARYGSNAPPSKELEFPEHCKTCKQCAGGPEQGLCEEGFRLFQQDLRRAN